MISYTRALHNRIREIHFPNFKIILKPSRTESPDSDLIIDINGKRKKPFDY